MPLSDKHKRFCAEYLVDLNAGAAAARAGYSTRHPHNAAVQGHRILQREDVKAEVARLQQRRVERTEVDAARVLRELERIALVDLRQAFDDRGRLKPIHELPEDVARALSGVEVEELYEGQGKDRIPIGVLRKVKFWDKPRGIELFMRHFGMLIERHEVDDITNMTPAQRAARVAALFAKGLTHGK